MRYAKILLFTLAYITLALNTPANCAEQNLIKNGSFEKSGYRETFHSLTLKAICTDIQHWKISHESIKYVFKEWPASEGKYSIDMTGHKPGMIEQSFETTPSAWYKLTFDMAGNPAGVQGDKALQVDVAEKSEIFVFNTIDHSPINMGWKKQSLLFQATESTTTLRFKSLSKIADVHAAGPVIDNVKVVSAPAPPPAPTPPQPPTPAPAPTAPPEEKPDAKKGDEKTCNSLTFNIIHSMEAKVGPENKIDKTEEGEDKSGFYEISGLKTDDITLKVFKDNKIQSTGKLKLMEKTKDGDIYLTEKTADGLLNFFAILPKSNIVIFTRQIKDENKNIIVRQAVSAITSTF